ncbi:hypothetical protein SBA3_2710005 [Candidatus Sulfopaludibacter sp. SbA3]|nr:hypothetical protein SBA3_2710005 [Candidatus Sulfopaludibacter sp. SbA3]
MTLTNLAVVLQEIIFQGQLDLIREYLRRFWEAAEDVGIRLEGRVALRSAGFRI